MARFLSFILISAALHAVPAVAQSVRCGSARGDGFAELAGMVESVTPRDTVKIKRANVGDSAPYEPAKYHTLLCAGDELVMMADAELRANLYGKPKTYVAGDPVLKIPRRESGSATLQGRSLLDRFWPFVTSIRRQLPVYAWSRGEVSSAPPVLIADPLSPPGRQMLPAQANHVALLWRGGASNIKVKSDNGIARLVENHRYAWTIVSLPRGARRWELTSEDGTLSWTIEIGGEAPPNSPGESGSDPLSETDRLARAIWLLSHGPERWRLFALTELSDLADAGNVAAIQFWWGARTGELQGEIMP